MKPLLLLTVLFIQQLWSFAQSPPPDFVYLDGKQFKHADGTNFYPMVMNYGVQIVQNPGTSEFFLASDADYGPNDVFDCTDKISSEAIMSNEIDLIKLNGFNTIRVGIEPIYHAGLTQNSRMFSLRYRNALGPQPQNDQLIDIGMPNFNNTAADNLFGIIADFMDFAETTNIKIILITIRPGPKNANTGINEFYPAYDLTASNDYSNYLSKLALVVANKPALLAYDLFNEPLYNSMYKDYTDPIYPIDLTKQKICEYESSWYDAIKQNNDTNHLITIGCSSTDEVFYWDMGILKLDFFSLHIYPKYDPYWFDELDPAGSSADAIAVAMNHYKIIMYWMSQVCPMPWIIGETGFSADDMSYSNPSYLEEYLDNNPLHHLPPFMFGNETQLTAFASQSLLDARNAGASGFSWWSFQNVSYYDYNMGWLLGFWPDCMMENYFGLYHHGTPSNPYPIKTGLGSVFATYLNLNGQPPAITPLAEPDFYYDPHQIYSGLNTTPSTMVSGTVLNEKGNPIKNAVISGTNWLHTEDENNPQTPFNPNDDTFYYDSPFTFSHSYGLNVGSFEIVPYNYYQPSITNAHRIINIRFTEVGAAHGKIGPGWIYINGYGDQQLTPSSLGGLTLKDVSIGYDAVVSNETVNAGETRNYYGRNSLTASNLTLNGNSNLTAHNQININSEFRSGSGSEVHIYISGGYIDCGDFNGFLRTANPSASNQEIIQRTSKEIEMNFIRSKSLIAHIYPNPNDGIFAISILNPEKNEVSIKLQNLLSETIWTTQTDRTNVLAEFEFLPKGIYLMQINNKRQVVTKKVIVN